MGHIHHRHRRAVVRLGSAAVIIRRRRSRRRTWLPGRRRRRRRAAATIAASSDARRVHRHGGPNRNGSAALHRWSGGNRHGGGRLSKWRAAGVIHRGVAHIGGGARNNLSFRRLGATIGWAAVVHCQRTRRSHGHRCHRCRCGRWIPCRQLTGKDLKEEGCVGRTALRPQSRPTRSSTRVLERD